MKQKKLRGYVMPTLYVIILMLIFGTVSLVSTILKDNPNYLYSIGILKTIDSTPVVNVDGALSDGIVRPYTEDYVSIDKYFYDQEDSEETQQKALIYFENTYMKNTGVLYKADKTFEAVMVLDGTIENVKQDEILGNVVEVLHNSNLRTIYYGLNEIKVKAGDVLSQGEAIGTSGASKISKIENTLLFEVYYNGKLINPEKFYSMDPATLN